MKDAMRRTLSYSKNNPGTWKVKDDDTVRSCSAPG
jgi:hypothetical protein